jgi:hypothetical protein
VPPYKWDRCGSPGIFPDVSIAHDKSNTFPDNSLLVFVSTKYWLVNTNNYQYLMAVIVDFGAPNLEVFPVFIALTGQF